MKRFDYDFDAYVEAQIAANRRKQNVVWVSRHNIAFIAEYLSNMNPSVIVCHGTRNGREQTYFAQHFPNAHIVGTEISPEGEKYPMTVCHDFHEPLGLKSDLTYTNSFDHVFDPERALSTWMSETECLMVEHSDCDFDHRVTEHDPFGASFEEMEQLLGRFGAVVDVLQLPDIHRGAKDQRVFVVQHAH